MRKRTRWYPVSIKPVRDGGYEWKCWFVTDGEIAHAEWARDEWIDATGSKLFTPRFECVSCQWRGLTRPAEE